MDVARPDPADELVDEPADELAAAWRRAERVVVLTGAGISTASGIPDFRSPGGRWENYQPVTIQEFVADEASRREYWRYKGETWQVMRAARPNPAHQALVDLEAAARLDLLVTQNVDGLHQASGFPADRLITIHGTDAAVECLQCGFRGPREPAQEAWEAGTAVPLCADCGGWLKPAVIAFGQSLVRADLERAFAAAAACDLFVAVGTSLVVSPINMMMSVAQQAGTDTAILTGSETPFDGAVRWKLEQRLERVLPRIRDTVLGEI